MLEKNRADNVAQGRRVGLPSQSKTSTICDQSAKRDLDEELTIRIALFLISNWGEWGTFLCVGKFQLN